MLAEAEARMPCKCLHEPVTLCHLLLLTLSHSFWSSFIAVVDKMSGRMLRACPSLMYAGPSRVTMFRSWMALFTSFACRHTQGSAEGQVTKNPAFLQKSSQGHWSLQPCEASRVGDGA